MFLYLHQQNTQSEKHQKTKYEIQQLILSQQTYCYSILHIALKMLEVKMNMFLRQLFEEKPLNYCIY